ncbi:MAG: hypothetical protein GY711_25460 [bacterium]|nr:hypothetical protein [bacterium]
MRTRRASWRLLSLAGYLPLFALSFALSNFDFDRYAPPVEVGQYRYLVTPFVFAALLIGAAVAKLRAAGRRRASATLAGAALATSAFTVPLALETVSTEPEIAAIADLVRTELRGTEVGIGFSCGPDGRTWGGAGMDAAVRAFEWAAVSAFFVQCTRYDLAGTALAHLVRALEAARSSAVAGVYANDGRVWKDRRRHGERVTPVAYADCAEQWRRLGARLIGGCCGTTCAHVSELRRRLSARAL